MGTSICMNASCGLTTSDDVKTGWPLRSGGFALLCHKCGSAYESLIYCETFHSEETGWRNCSLCGRHIHCGCIASKSLFEYLDYGGVGCITCMKGSQFHLILRGELRNGSLMTKHKVGDFHSTSVENCINGNIGDENLSHLCKIGEANGDSLLSPPRKDDFNGSLGQSIRENIKSSRSSNVIRSSLKSPYENPDSSIFFTEVKNIKECLAQPSLSMNLGPPLGFNNLVLPFGAVESREHEKVPHSFQKSQKSRPILPKPMKNSTTPTNSEANNIIRHLRIARPPAEGRGKNQLLPRYWPRITDQELEQLSGDLNSTIVPLFEKVLSASDAGRIGRLVLPKACAEAYFPHISQSEGLPIRIQDVKGNEWTFQFRFWPNNNSRMYVLEGVTPCIQSMQLQAGDTVIFSRIDPEGKLVMGFRKSTNSVDQQDGQSLVLTNCSKVGEPSFSSTMDDNLQTEDRNSHKFENHGDITNDHQIQHQMPVVDKKRARNIGPKNKRLLMHSEDAMELRLTWEEAQDLLRPPIKAKPSIVTIEEHEFEEYDEPPIFGKRTLFTADSSKGQEQWAQCDECSKWRKLPVDVLLPSKWTCSDNVWDTIRCSCSEPEEISPKELNNLMRAKKDHSKRRMTEKHEPYFEFEASGLDALASAAVLGEDYVLEPEIGATTKHPRHRAGCSCIVCIQPPSGKGKHKTTCTCNVCLTVKRRFKTLMSRKKKRQSDRKFEREADVHGGACRDADMQGTELELADREWKSEIGARGEKIDLNCDPNREEAMLGSRLVRSDDFPLDRIKGRDAVSGLIGEEDVMVPLLQGR